MNPIFYKVIFKPLKEYEDNAFSLTFRNVNEQNPIIIPSYYIITLKELSKENKNIINFQNIQEVIKIGENGFNYNFNYYIVLLFTYTENNKKQGFLMGNVKKLGDLLIGVWPFNLEQISYNSDLIIEILNSLINKNEFDKICIISS
ncbi:MAG: hypothetical protein ACFFKA_08535 [Candidatus Thorarchaeota archaeon]